MTNRGIGQASILQDWVRALQQNHFCRPSVQTQVLNFPELFGIFSAEDSGETESIKANPRFQGARTQMSHYYYLFQVEAECELSPEALTAMDFHQQSLSSVLGTAWHLLKSTFMDQSELRIWPERDDSEQFSWCVYNPLSGQSRRFASEDDVRLWIEQVYYRS